MERPGDPILNSKYLRGFCIRCAEPLRLVSFDPEKEYYCEECSPPHCPTCGRDPGSFPDRQYHGGQFHKGEW
jgi:hypothetical protein